MFARRVFCACLPVLVVLSFTAHPGARQGAVPVPSRGAQQPTFRGGVTAVPIEVRVVDESGRPVVGLRADDFAVFEDDVPQAIVHFSHQVLEALPPGPGLRARAEVPFPDPRAELQTHRIFLIMLGPGSIGSNDLVSVSPSGSVHGPPTLSPYASNVIDGLVHFVRERLLPQDQVAVLAYNRATDFTANHEAVAALLEKFRESEAAGIAAMAQQPLATPAAPERARDDPQPDTDPGTSVDLGFAEYVQARSAGSGEVENLRYGLKYLRYMEGEKHLLWVTANGVIEPMPGSLAAARSTTASAGPKELAADASDARVAVHAIHSGGMSANPGQFVAPLPILRPPLIVAPGVAQWGGGNSGGSNKIAVERSTDPHASVATPGWDRPAPAPGVPVPGLTAAGMQAIADLRMVAALTGGSASGLTLAMDAVDRIDGQTRASYLLVYYPTNAAYDGRYRNVRVEVKRPNVTVLFRHGYYARQQETALDRRAVMTEGRFAMLARTPEGVSDLAVRATPTFTKGKSGRGGETNVSLVIDIARLGWRTDDLSRRVAHLDLRIYCGDAREKVLGYATRTLDITLTERRFIQLAERGLTHTVQVPVSARPRFVKVMVYNYESNLVGSTIVLMK